MLGSTAHQDNGPGHMAAVCPEFVVDHKVEAWYNRNTVLQARVLAQLGQILAWPGKACVTMLDPIATDALDRLHISGDGDDSVRWSGVFVTYGGQGADQSTTIVFEIEPGHRLGWHTDQTEETQYIIAGTGELQRDDGSFPVGPGSVFTLPTNVGHDLVNTGTETMRAVAFFSAAMFTQTFDNVMQPVNSHILGTPNRNGENSPAPRAIVSAES